MKSFTLDGKRHKINRRVPIAEVRHLIGQQHVSTTDDEIIALIAARTTSWPRAAIDSAKRLAVYFHRNNQKLFTELRL